MPRVLDLITAGKFRSVAITEAIVAWPDAADALMAQPQKLVIRR